MSAKSYVFGHTEREIARLNLQGQLLAPFTRSVLAAAGISSGARVMDFGCGSGDVSLLLAEIVGPTGHVLALDKAPDALAATKALSEQSGYAQIEVAQRDFGDPQALDLPQGFDAAVGRLVLAHVPDRSGLIARTAAALRPGGTLAFMEYDLFNNGALAPSPLSERMLGWVVETFRHGGFGTDVGSQLFGLFADAGLHAELTAGMPASGGADGPVVDVFIQVVRSMLPNIVAAGVATEEEIDVDTLADRLRAEPGADRRSFYMPLITGAWARTPTA